MDWRRAFRSFFARVRTPERGAYLREHERERELEMHQIRQMTGADGSAGDAAAGNDSDSGRKK